MNSLKNSFLGGFLSGFGKYSKIQGVCDWKGANYERLLRALPPPCFSKIRKLKSTQ